MLEDTRNPFQKARYRFVFAHSLAYRVCWFFIIATFVALLASRLLISDSSVYANIESIAYVFLIIVGIISEVIKSLVLRKNKDQVEEIIKKIPSTEVRVWKVILFSAIVVGLIGIIATVLINK